jgi:hypothetical protein
MNILNFIVDFAGVKNKQEVIDRLISVFQLPDAGNWDSFQDWFTSLESDSAIVNSMNPLPQKIHLDVKNIADVKKVSQRDYDILLEILNEGIQSEKPENKIKFSFKFII